ncbi:hypothetical protein [Actinophytocola sp.]|uniref:hypothetical protein n=1 Tax=Actinophytocola sp. TaxID=1872138 RepID=UPI002D59825F|nr:hypothetical protein [Actinophytocola sp.]HYQ64426.1 hypothetical protein [Actinophytocola sp.]
MRIALLAPVALILVATACAAQPEQRQKQPQVVEMAADVEISSNETVTWVEGKVDDSGEFESVVVPVANAERTSARFAAEVELLTPQGCQEPFVDLKIDDDALGQVRCTFDGYRRLGEHHAPKIWLDADGRITKMADRYHP